MYIVVGSLPVFFIVVRHFVRLGFRRRRRRRVPPRHGVISILYTAAVIIDLTDELQR